MPSPGRVVGTDTKARERVLNPQGEFRGVGGFQALHLPAPGSHVPATMPGGHSGPRRTLMLSRSLSAGT